MPVPVPPLQQAELPKRKTALFKMMGPGIVMAGIAIGSGELIMWPWITSIVGAQLIWAAAIGIFLQLWINVEVGRWTVVTGESPLIGMVRVVKLIVYLWVFLVVVGKFLPGWARETGVSLRSLIFGNREQESPRVALGGVGVDRDRVRRDRGHSLRTQGHLYRGRTLHHGARRRHRGRPDLRRLGDRISGSLRRHVARPAERGGVSRTFPSRSRRLTAKHVRHSHSASSSARSYSRAWGASAICTTPTTCAKRRSAWANGCRRS